MRCDTEPPWCPHNSWNRILWPVRREPPTGPGEMGRRLPAGEMEESWASEEHRQTLSLLPRSHGAMSLGPTDKGEGRAQSHSFGTMIVQTHSGHYSMLSLKTCLFSLPAHTLSPLLSPACPPEQVPVWELKPQEILHFPVNITFCSLKKYKKV